jgi:glycerophosphoryl diester phosphodiesterase
LAPGPAGFAHRGRHGPFPFVENSLTAFAACLEMGAGVECDVRLTRDGEIVVFHDSDAARLTGMNAVIEQSTLDELRRLPFANQPIPTLGELLALVDGRAPILIEVKCEGRRTDWYRALDQALKGYRGRYGVMSFDPLMMHWIRAKLPQIRRGMVINDRLGWLGRWSALRHARPNFVAVETDAAARPWAQKLRARMPLYSWTVKDRETRARLEPLTDALIWEVDGRP